MQVGFCQTGRSTTLWLCGRLLLSVFTITHLKTWRKIFHETNFSVYKNNNKKSTKEDFLSHQIFEKAFRFFTTFLQNASVAFWRGLGMFPNKHSTHVHTLTFRQKCKCVYMSALLAILWKWGFSQRSLCFSLHRQTVQNTLRRFRRTRRVCAPDLINIGRYWQIFFMDFGIDFGI